MESPRFKGDRFPDSQMNFVRPFAMGRRAAVGLLVTIFLVQSMVALAAGSLRGELLSKSDLRVSRKEAQQTKGDLLLIDLAETQIPECPDWSKIKWSSIDWTATVGASYTDGENHDKTWLTPFEIDADLTKCTTLKLIGDGYGYVRPGAGGTNDGLNDATLTLSQRIYKDEKSTMRIGLGFAIPAGGELGSTSGQEKFSVSYIRNITGSWSMLGAGRLSYLNGDQTDGISRIGKFGLVQFTYDLNHGQSAPVSHDIYIQLARSQRSGASGQTQALIEYEFPIAATPTLGYAISAFRGLSSGTRDNGLEFDVTFSF